MFCCEFHLKINNSPTLAPFLSGRLVALDLLVTMADAGRRVWNMWKAVCFCLKDMEPISEGQVHVVKRVPPAEREDPGGVFARPRRGAEDDVSEDKSIGEIVSSGSNRRERFRKWKERRCA